MYEGKAFIKSGIAWFTSVFVISLIIDLWQMGYSDRGAALFFFSLFFNLPVTCILIGFGAKKLNSYADRNPEFVRGYAKKIVYFGIFWLIFWFISSAIVSSKSPDPRIVFVVFLLFITIPGAITIIAFGIWLFLKVRLLPEVNRITNENEIRLILEILKNSQKRDGITLYSNKTPIYPEHAECPFCSKNIQKSFHEHGGVIKCPKCKVFYHKECFEVGGCGSLDCRISK